ncbi:MAG TPA: bifunctional 2-polyprenyl-6-hydroxyphenol methylase/3-demethylubiquinol 3-O-methyltransferase UbiG [Dongiaceae bacterium]|nr:bifunctional 2-polyprenyl-6-hydroxyphenol methylase/3-demethylubiquinol 3-O-methyltransferase UbiG [Dongiaceae bacterium]
MSLGTTPTQSGPLHPHGSTVDHEEVAKFTAMAEAWWDPQGKFRPLHRLNPVRVEYIVDMVKKHFGGSEAADGSTTATPLAGLAMLDIGCGGGLLAEPLARLGAQVTGIDAAERNIAIARAHAEQTGTRITYLPCAAEDLLSGQQHGQQRFDVVLAMEVIEHVSDPAVFLATAAALMKPNGLLFVATLNRTVKSYALAIVGAEYIMRWLPRGTHDWRKFMRPSEIARPLRQAGLAIHDIAGVTYHPLSDRWQRSRDLDVNYMLCASH